MTKITASTFLALATVRPLHRQDGLFPSGARDSAVSPRRAHFARAAKMSAGRTLYPVAVLGLLLSRAPRSVQRVVGWMLFGAILTVVLIALATVARADVVCTVSDPTGTPLNVRAQPKQNGSILGALNNDTSVVVKERRGQWASIVGRASYPRALASRVGSGQST